MIKTIINVCFSLILVLTTSFTYSHTAHAHALDQSIIFLTISDDAIEGRIEINLVDLNSLLGSNLPEDKTATLAQIEPYFPTITRYLNDNVTIALGNGFSAANYDLYTYPNLQYLIVPFVFSTPTGIPDFIDFNYTVMFDKNPKHKGILVIENDWRSGTFHQETNIVNTFTKSDPSKRLDLTGPTVTQGYVAMFKLGVHHIWEGIDHILFLIALLLPAVLYRDQQSKWQPVTKFKPAFMYVVKVVTFFTLAHTITLSAATLGWLTLSSRLVESIIALSIAVAAIDMLTPVFRGRIWLVIFVFGLFHGFGFASVLGEYAIPNGYLTWSLLAFNVGVEAGQLAIVAIVVPALFLFRRLPFYSTFFLWLAAGSLVAVSMYWFIERGFLIDLPAGSILKWFLGLFI